MSALQYLLSDEELAQHYLALRAVRPDQDAADVEASVRDFLGPTMSHRSAFAVATEVVKRTRRPLPSPEEAARLDDLHQGIGDQRPMTEAELAAHDWALAEKVSNMSMADYARYRQQLGVGQPDVLTFLGGGR